MSLGTSFFPKGNALSTQASFSQEEEVKSEDSGDNYNPLKNDFLLCQYKVIVVTGLSPNSSNP